MKTERMTEPELMWWILFGPAVAGKGSLLTREKLNDFLNLETGENPFAKVRVMIQWGTLRRNLKHVRMGKYNLLEKAYRAAVRLDLSSLTLEGLENIPGIGPKTARMILLYAGFRDDVVPLDTHVLKFLKAEGIEKVPKATPGSKSTYSRLEAAFQKIATARGLTVRELDTQVWRFYARGYGQIQ